MEIEDMNEEELRGYRCALEDMDDTIKIMLEYINICREMIAKLRKESYIIHKMEEEE